MQNLPAAAGDDSMPLYMLLLLLQSLASNDELHNSDT